MTVRLLNVFFGRLTSVRWLATWLLPDLCVGSGVVNVICALPTVNAWFVRFVIVTVTVVVLLPLLVVNPITDDAELTQARLWLTEACRIGLANALGLLGVGAPEEMSRLDADDDAPED